MSSILSSVLQFVSPSSYHSSEGESSSVSLPIASTVPTGVAPKPKPLVPEQNPIDKEVRSQTNRAHGWYDKKVFLTFMGQTTAPLAVGKLFEDEGARKLNERPFQPERYNRDRVNTWAKLPSSSVTSFSSPAADSSVVVWMECAAPSYGRSSNYMQVSMGLQSADAVLLCVEPGVSEMQLNAHLEFMKMTFKKTPGGSRSKPVMIAYYDFCRMTRKRTKDMEVSEKFAKENGLAFWDVSCGSPARQQISSLLSFPPEKFLELPLVTSEDAISAAYPTYPRLRQVPRKSTKPPPRKRLVVAPQKAISAVLVKATEEEEKRKNETQALVLKPPLSPSSIGLPPSILAA